MTSLLAEVIRTLAPVVDVPATGRARTQLSALVRPLVGQMTTRDRVVAAAVQLAASDPVLRVLVDGELLEPLRAGMRRILERHSSPSIDPASYLTAVTLVEGLWCRRYLLDQATPAPVDATSIVNVLLHLLTGTGTDLDSDRVARAWAT